MRASVLTAGLIAFAVAPLSAQGPAYQGLLPDSVVQLPIGLDLVQDTGYAYKRKKPFPPCDYYNYGTDRNEGRLEGKRQKDYSWFGAGAATALVMPLVGPAVVSIYAFKAKAPVPDSIPAEWNKDCYYEGYRRQSQNQHASSAFFGGLAGVAVGLLTVYVLHVDDAIVFPLVPGDFGDDN